MKILYFTHFLSSKGGGGEVVFYDLARGMASRGHEVHVICNKISDTEGENIDGVSVHRIEPAVKADNEYFLSMPKHFLFVIRALICGYKLFRSGRFDLIHANTITPVIAASVLGKIFHVPVIRTVHDVYSAVSEDYWRDWGEQQSVSRISTLVAPFYEKFVLRLPTTVTHTVSETTKNDLLETNFKGNIVVIPNGLDLKQPHYELPARLVYDKYLIFIGRLIVTKNVDTIISALELVVKRLPNAKLIIVGEGPMKDVWRREVKNKNLDANVHLVGYVSQSRKVELLRDCSALLFPSVVEGFGLVILEAFSMSKPVIVSDIRPLNEIVDNEINGYLAKPYVVEDWSRKIIALLSDKDLCQKMGMAGRLKLEEKYDFRRVLEKMEHLYINLLDKNQSRSLNAAL